MDATISVGLSNLGLVILCYGAYFTVMAPDGTKRAEFLWWGIGFNFFFPALMIVSFGPQAIGIGCFILGCIALLGGVVTWRNGATVSNK